MEAREGDMKECEECLGTGSVEAVVLNEGTIKHHSIELRPCPKCCGVGVESEPYEKSEESS
jgi:DnaJ-class molecular chaperone